ncbi:unnamed protein product [Lampetra planeri]
MATLLPPLGTNAFRLFTKESLVEIERRTEERRKVAEVEGHQEAEPAAAHADLEAGKNLPMIYETLPQR